MYTVWLSQGQGGMEGPEFATLNQAKRWCIDHWGEASFAIKRPDGTWYKWYPDAWDYPIELPDLVY